jgi:hypothetical protein
MSHGTRLALLSSRNSKIIFPGELTMKTLIALIMTMSFSAISYAEVKAPGTFVPSKCSKVLYPNKILLDNPIRELCVGSVVGSEIAAISAVRMDGSSMVYAIKEITPVNPTVLAYTLESRTGETAVLQVTTNGADIVAAVGQDDAVKFVASQFQLMFTTMGAVTQ